MRSTAQGPVVEALVRVAGTQVACTLSPVTWDAGLTQVDPAGRGEIYLSGGTTGIKSIVEEAAAYYSGAGVTRRDADRIGSRSSTVGPSSVRSARTAPGR